MSVLLSILDPRRFIRRSAFALAARMAPVDISSTIVISGSGRSGTTALFEALLRADGYKGLDEPRFSRQRGSSVRPFLDGTDGTKQDQEVFQGILEGRLGKGGPWRFPMQGESQVLQHLTRRRLTVKFIKMARSMRWIDEHFGVRRIVFVVRHPVAVVSSMMKHPGWAPIVSEPDKPVRALDLEEVPSAQREKFREVVDSVGTAEEALAAIWTLDTYTALYCGETHPWVLVPYERWVASPSEELDRICSACQIESNGEMLKALRRPSSSARGGFENDVEKQLSKWKEEMTADQIDKVLGIVRTAGLGHIYSDDITPDFDALDSFQDPRWRRDRW